MAYHHEDSQVWVMSAGDKKRLSRGDGIGVNPSISHGGTKVAFAEGPREGDTDLYVINVDGSDKELVRAGETEQSASDWSPDDSAIVFDEWFDENGMQVFTIRLDGSEPVQLTDGEANAKPKWSPGGESIVFLSLRDGPRQEIYAMNADGSDQVNLTDDHAIDVLAEYSPDGTSLAFVSDRSGNFDIWIMDPDGSNPIQLTSDQSRDLNPTWSSDGKHILFFSDRDPAGLWAMRSDGSEQSPILDGAWLASCP